MRLFEFTTPLLEYKRGITIQKLGDKLQAATGLNVDDVLNQLEQIDPTKNKQYVEWLCRQLINKKFRLEDYPRVNSVLVDFENIKRRLPQKDINQYDLHKLEQTIDDIMDVKIDTSNEHVPVDGIKVLYDGPLGMLTIPETEEASKFLGRGTKWCTAADKNNAFNGYSSDGPLYVWRDKNGKKYQFHFQTYQFMDDKDRPLSKDIMDYFRTKNPVTSKLFDQQEDLILSSAKRHPRSAVYYAADVMHGRWPEAEPSIMTDPQAIVMYARSVINGRWPEAERSLLKSRNAAFYAEIYARTVIKGRWPEAEPYIKADPDSWAAYVNNTK